MAYTKTQKPLKISAKKSEYFVDWFIEADYKLICKKLDIKTTKAYSLKNKFVKNRSENVKDFDSIAEQFTLKEINSLLELYNEYIENPEAFEKPKKKAEVDLDKQEEAINKNISEMGFGSLKYKRTEKQDENKTNEETEKLESKGQIEDQSNKEDELKQEDTRQSEEQTEREADGKQEEELLYKNGIAFRFKERAIIEKMSNTELLKLHSEEMVRERDILDKLEKGTEAYREQEIRIKYIQNRNHAEYHKLLKMKKGR